MSKRDPTKQIRALASKKSREKKDSYVYVEEIFSSAGNTYKLNSKRSNCSILLYKNGSEIAL